MRTPDKIKKGLECCSNVNFVCNEECPYYKSLSEGEDCCLKKNADALVYIQQLEAKNVELSGEIGQLEAERDAAVKDLQTVCNMMNICSMYKDHAEGSERCDGCETSSNWQWRGVTKEE